MCNRRRRGARLRRRPRAPYPWIFAVVFGLASAGGCRDDVAPAIFPLSAESLDTPVILISIDTLRADHIGLYGYPRPTTPNLDRFFETRTVFDSAMSASPCAIPSVKQFLSGRFSPRNDRATLAEVLRDHGYRTAAVVSQHQFRLDAPEFYRRGFDSFDIQEAEEVDHHGMTTRTAAEISDRAITWMELSWRSV